MRIGVGGLILVAVATLLGGASAARGAISVSPAYVEVSLDKGQPAGHFVIANLGDAEERYRIKSISFAFQENGGLQQVQAGKHSLAEWIRFNPREFVLGAKAKQVIRFVVLPRGRLEPGEYWGGIELESLKTQTGVGQDAAGRQYAVEIVPTILVPVFATSGAVRHEAALTEIKLTATPEGGVVEALVTNSGTGRLLANASYTLSDAKGEVVYSGPLGYSYVLRESTRRFKATVPRDLAAGSYKLAVICKCPQLSQAMTGETAVELKETIIVHKEPDLTDPSPAAGSTTGETPKRDAPKTEASKSEVPTKEGAPKEEKADGRPQQSVGQGAGDTRHEEAVATRIEARS